MSDNPATLDGFTCPIPLTHNDQIVLGHGSGGRMSFDLINKVFIAQLSNSILDTGDDAGLITIPVVDNKDGLRLAISTDSHVVTPLFFPGGDIGRLAICGTVNDVSMLGATPLYMTAGFILEEGLEVDTLRRIVDSMRSAASEAGIRLIAGDTKVVQRGKADGVFINTTGIGLIPKDVNISGKNARPGDAVVVSGTIGDHGIAILAARGDLHFEASIKSDVAPLNSLVSTMLDMTKDIHVLRDPTRGGLATSLNEISRQSNIGIQIYENAVPINPVVEAACEMLGLDPFYVANEGKLIAIVDINCAERVVDAMKKHPLGANASIIGTVTDKADTHVLLKTSYGTTRIIDMMSGEMLPRIC